MKQVWLAAFIILGVTAGCGQTDDAAQTGDVVIALPSTTSGMTTTTGNATTAPPATSKGTAETAAVTEPPKAKPQPAPATTSPPADTKPAAPKPADVPSTEAPTTITTATTCPPAQADFDGLLVSINCRGKREYLTSIAEKMTVSAGRECFVNALEPLPSEVLAETFKSNGTVSPAVRDALLTCRQEQ